MHEEYDDPVVYPAILNRTEFFRTLEPVRYSTKFTARHSRLSQLLDDMFQMNSLRQLLKPLLVRRAVSSFPKYVCVRMLTDYIILLLLEGRTTNFDTLMNEMNRAEKSPRFSLYKEIFPKFDMYRTAQPLVDFSKKLVDESMEWPPVYPINIKSRLTPVIFVDLMPNNSFIQIQFTIPDRPGPHSPRKYFLYTGRITGSFEGRYEYFECKKANLTMLTSMMRRTKEEWVQEISLNEEHKSDILAKKTQFQLFTENLPENASESVSEELTQKLRNPQHKMKPTIRNFEWTRPGQVRFLINGYEQEKGSNILPISEYDLLFCGTTNVLTIQVGRHPLENLPFVVQIIEADVDSTTWNQKIVSASPVKNNSTAVVDDVEPLEITLSLLCPIRLTRMVNPMRASDCEHLGCFDMNSLKLVMKARNTFKCPNCNQIRSILNLRECQFMKNILKSTEESVDQVIVDTSNMNWRVKPLSSGQKENDYGERMPKIPCFAADVPLFDGVELNAPSSTQGSSVVNAIILD